MHVTQGSLSSQQRGNRTRVSSCSDAKDYWSEFCRGTPIHGVKYLVETERPLYERLWWVGVLLVCLYFATEYSLELWFRLTVKPTDHTTQIVSRYEDIVKIPFPALTFCDNMKSIQNKASETTSFLCGQGYENGNTNMTKHIDIGLLAKMAPVFNSSCKINHHYLPDIENYISHCEKMFTRILTQHGICYTFNMLDTSEVFNHGIVNYYTAHHRLSDWSPGKGYREGAPLADENGTSDPLHSGPFPKRAISWVITFEIFLEPEDHGTFCADDKSGIKLAVHNPVEMPRIGHRDNQWLPSQSEKKEEKEAEYVDLEKGKEYYVDADPEMMWTNKIFKYVPPNVRHCYFHGEKKLLYFKYYTQTNCENECLINVTLQECGCVDFYMPHDKDTILCSPDRLGCMMEALDWSKKRGFRQCSCYPACKHLKYHTDLYYKRHLGPSDKTKEKKSIKLTVYITDSQFVSKEQKKVQTPYYLVDFVANCGGVFGLFCGMSIVSIIDFGYYGTLRLVSDFFRRRKKIKESESSL